MLAYILVTLSEKTEEKVKEKLKKMPEVREAHVVFGEWDIILKVEVESPEALSTFIIDKVRAMKDIKFTSTLIVAA